MDENPPAGGLLSGVENLVSELPPPHIAAMASKFTVAHTPAWAKFVDAVFG